MAAFVIILASMTIGEATSVVASNSGKLHPQKELVVGRHAADKHYTNK